MSIERRRAGLFVIFHLTFLIRNFPPSSAGRGLGEGLAGTKPLPLFLSSFYAAYPLP